MFYYVELHLLDHYTHYSTVRFLNWQKFIIYTLKFLLNVIFTFCCDVDGYTECLDELSFIVQEYVIT
jgi:hypothetical protein